MPEPSSPPLSPALLPDFLDRLRAFASRSAAFNRATVEACSAVAGAPAIAIAAIDPLLAQIPELEGTDLGLVAEAGALSAKTPDRCRSGWRQTRTDLLESRWSAAERLGSQAERIRTSEMAHRLFEADLDDPFWATIDELDAAIAPDTPTVERLLDRAFAIRVAAAEFLAAARNRMHAAALAGVVARFDRQRDCIQRAIAVADEHNLQRERVAFRISQFAMLLIGDQTGAMRDQLRRELDFTSRPVGTLAALLQRVYDEGVDGFEQASSADAAAALARAYGLVGEARRCMEAKDSSDLARACQGAQAALNEQRSGQMLDLLLLCAQFKNALGDAETSVLDILPQALTLAATPEALCRVHSAFADAWEMRGKLLRAIAAASDAFEAVRDAGTATTRAQAEARLSTLRCQLSTPEAALQQDPALDVDDYVTRRAQSATAALIAHDFAGAMTTLDEALPLARAATKRGELQMLRGAALYELDRLDEALDAVRSAASIFSTAFEADPGPDGNLLGQRETAYLMSAFLFARLGRNVESWTAAETGRSYLLRRRLAVPLCRWEVVRAALQQRKAALLEICVLRWGTLLITASSMDEEPTAEVFPSFCASDVNRLLESPGLGDDSDRWTEILMGAMPGLSLALMPMLQEKLTGAVAGADVLYVITDGPLAHAPLAALEVRPDCTLAELIPFALVPFASLLAIREQHAAPNRSVRAAALATGKDLTGFDFANHLAVLQPVLSAMNAAKRSGSDATSSALKESIEHAELVYLSSHGTLDHLISEVDRASSLILADAVVASADVAGCSSEFSLTDATVVFLNACQSGRFRALTRTEFGGFPGACLAAGRRTLIAPLTHVDPQAAVSIAAVCLQEIRSGKAVSAALQTARLRLKDAGAPPSAWAAHQMFGLDTPLYAERLPS